MGGNDRRLVTGSMAEVESQKVHVVDYDSRRRAKIAFDLRALDLRAEIYEHIDEAVAADPKDGILLLNDNTQSSISEQKTQSIAIPFALYGEEPSVSQVVDAMLTGAIDYLEWPFDAERVAKALARFENDHNSPAQGAARRRRAISAVEALSSREQAVLRQMVLGASNKEIAANLGISPRTVEVHRANMLVKLQAKSSADAVRIGIYAGLDG